MSDNISDNVSQAYRRARQLVHEFPISYPSLSNRHEGAQTATHNLNELGQDVERLARELSEGRRLSGQSTLIRAVADAVTNAVTELLATDPSANNMSAARQRQRELRTQLHALGTRHGAMGGALPAPALASGGPAESKMPIRSLVSMLPRTAYREQREKEFVRSLEYVRIQRKILRALEKYDTDLTAKDAYIWTRAIVPTGQRPEPQQALRLCYYMRSLGYDTFASVKTTHDPIDQTKTTSLRLFVANPDSEKRGLGYDHLYWAHNLRTGEVVSRAYSLLRQDTQGSTRRNALANVLDLGPSFSAEMINEQMREQYEGSVQMRGGGVQATGRYDLTGTCETFQEASLRVQQVRYADTSLDRLLDVLTDPE